MNSWAAMATTPTPAARGADRFVFAPDEAGHRIISDFTAAEGDVIVLREGHDGWPSVADILATVAARGDRYLVYNPVGRADGGDGHAAAGRGLRCGIGAT